MNDCADPFEKMCADVEREGPRERPYQVNEAVRLCRWQGARWQDRENRGLTQDCVSLLFPAPPASVQNGRGGETKVAGKRLPCHGGHRRAGPPPESPSGHRCV